MERTKIIDLETAEVGWIIDMLSTQFTVDMNGKIRFYFFRDRDITWRPVNDS